jgi:GT2 family glycosyltransferase
MSGRGSCTLAYTTVIPTKDRPARVEATVSALLSQTRLPARIVLVDASSPPLTPSHELQERSSAAGVELVVLESEASTSGQRNRGVEHVETPLILLLDDDVTLHAEFVQVLIDRWERDGLTAFGALVGTRMNGPRQRLLPRLLRLVGMLHYQAFRSASTSFRRSRKLRLVSRPAHEVMVPACGAGCTLLRTDLLRRHPFDERFSGYAPGEDLDMSCRLSADAPILQVPGACWTHDLSHKERTSVLRWRQRGRIETYFRARHLERSPFSIAAFALSLFAEAAIAAAYSVRHLDGHFLGYVSGVLETLREGGYRYVAPPAEPMRASPRREAVPLRASSRGAVDAVGASASPLNSPWRFTAAAAALTTAAAHFPVMEDNIEYAAYLGVLFALVSCLCVVLAAQLLWRDTREVWLAAAGVCAVALGVLAWSGELGVPRISDDVGRWTQPLAIIAACAEVTVVVLSVLALARRTVRALLLNRALPVSMGVAFLLLGLSATTVAATNDHAPRAPLHPRGQPR